MSGSGTLRPRSIVLWASACLALLLAPTFITFATPTPPAASADEPLAANGGDMPAGPGVRKPPGPAPAWDATILENSRRMLAEGRETFRFDTFGDEDFWGRQLRLHQAIAGAPNGGVGPGVSPRAALQLGLKVDVDALPASLVQQLRRGRVNLNDPKVTVDLLKLDAVVGVKGFFDRRTQRLSSLGIQCALCHSTVDNSLTFGMGRRLDGWPNRDLNVGAIIASAPDLSPYATLLGISQDAVRRVLNSWGPGKFDAELILDGKAFRPDGKPAATLIPAAYGLAGHNNHTWTGAWGTVTYWNAFVANLEMRGKGVFFDPRFEENPEQFPVAARNPTLFGRKRDPVDRISPKLAALHVYQLAIPAPKPRAGVDFNQDAARRGGALFLGRARCNNCHVRPLFTEPGWNLHKPEEIGIDSFQADRAPDRRYRTAALAGIFTRERGLFMRPENAGRFYHDGRFKTLLDVVNHYNAHFGLGLSAAQKQDLVEYLKSL